MVYVEWSALYVKDVFVTVASFLLWRRKPTTKNGFKRNRPFKDLISCTHLLEYVPYVCILFYSVCFCFI